MLNHVAILVNSVDRAAARLRNLGLVTHPKESFPGEGTSEIYVGGDSLGARLLLVEPAGPGPYTRAMEKRGPGLHHIAIDVAALEPFMATISGSGWYLLPQSLRTIRTAKTAWLGRPGTAALIEVHERAPTNAPPAITRVALPLNDKERRMFAALPVSQIIPARDDQTVLTMSGHDLTLTTLLA